MTTVVVTGANSYTGRMLLPRLKQMGTHTIGLVRKPVELDGADEIVTDWMNVRDALEALGRADVVVTLTGILAEARSKRDFCDAMITTTERVLSSVSQVRRFIDMSYIGASPDSKNEYKRNHGLREQMLIESGVETVIFRCPLIIDSPDNPGPIADYAPDENGVLMMAGDGTQRQQPVHRGDVADAIASAVEGGSPGIYDLVGPQVMSVDEIIRMVNPGRKVKVRYVPGWLARPLSYVIPDTTPTAVDIILRDAVGDPSRVVNEFNLKLTDVRSLWE